MVAATSKWLPLTPEAARHGREVLAWVPADRAAYIIRWASDEDRWISDESGLDWGSEEPGMLYAEIYPPGEHLK